MPAGAMEARLGVANIREVMENLKSARLVSAAKTGEHEVRGWRNLRQGRGRNLRYGR